jgi:nicotinate-nucleotide pyrophosphorylase (carboxylating)
MVRFKERGTSEEPRIDMEFRQIEWDADLADDCRQLVRLAVREDLDRWQDWTTLALIPQGARGESEIVARHTGVLAGLKAIPLLLEEMQAQLQWEPVQTEGNRVGPGETVGYLRGSLRDMLVVERPLLNLIGRLSGIATLTNQYVQQVEGLRAGIYDTRKTTPGWRRLEKYAVRCGGGRNHRTGLFDAVLIKDNHLALAGLAREPAAAVRRVRSYLSDLASHYPDLQQLLIEVEVDDLDQFRSALEAQPDIILLDNMTPAQLREAVEYRDSRQTTTQLEASGGVNLETIRGIAETGVERISVGAITHSAVNFDVALDIRNAKRNP